MRKKKSLLFVSLLIIILLLFLFPDVAAQEQIVINSKNWKDVYSGMLYAHHKNVDAHPIVEETQGLRLLDGTLERGRNVLLIESEDEPFIFGYGQRLERAGFDVERIAPPDGVEMAISLARKAAEEQDVTSFIIIDGNLGYEAIAVAPYAALTRASVLFLDGKNEETVLDIVQEHAEDILLYGHLSRAQKERFALLQPTIIDTGDRYTDNIEIVQRFLERQPTGQMLLTDGTFIEQGFFNDEFPVLFIGTTNVPERIIGFLQDQDVKTGVVIGYDLFENARILREQVGMRVFLKYGQGQNEQMFALDIFAIPSSTPQVVLAGARYNMLSEQLEIMYENTGEVFGYVQALSHEILADGESIATVGDKEVFFIDSKDRIAVTYDLDLLEYAGKDFTVKSRITYGQSPSFLTYLLSEEMPVDVISVKDDSQIRIFDILYNKETEEFEVSIENIGDHDVYADVDIIDLLVGGARLTVSADLQMIPAGKKGMLRIKASMQEADYSDNPAVQVRVRYGARADALIKSKTEEFEFIIKSKDYKKIAFIVILACIIILLARMRKRKR